MQSDAFPGRSHYTVPLPKGSADWAVLTALAQSALGQDAELWHKVAARSKAKRIRPIKKVKLAAQLAPAGQGVETTEAAEVPCEPVEALGPPDEDDFAVHTAVLNLETALEDVGSAKAAELLALLSASQAEGDWLALGAKLSHASHNRLEIRQAAIPEEGVEAVRSVLITIPALREDPNAAEELRAYGFDTSSPKTGHWLNALYHLAGSTYSGATRFKSNVRCSISWRTQRGDETGPVDPRASLATHRRKCLVIRLETSVSTSYRRMQAPLDDRLLDAFRLVFHTIYPPDFNDEQNLLEPLRLQDFYQALQPAPQISAELAAKLQPVEVTTPLFDFQLRSIAHLLKRERATYLDPVLCDTGGDPEGFWERMRLQGPLSKSIWVCRIMGRVVVEGVPVGQGVKAEEDRPPSCLNLPRVNAILADEMGLGKTLDVISLICLNRRTLSQPVAMFPGPDSKIPTTATLVVVPDLLLKQWQEEVRKHAPELGVVVYRGWRQLEEDYQHMQDPDNDSNSASATGQPSAAEWFCRRVVADQVDVILTGFHAVSLDFDVHQPPPNRASRSMQLQATKNVGPRTPLVRLQFWRVVLDETQMADPSGHTKIASTMRHISRIHALSVSGTPAKAELADLGGSLALVGLQIFPRLWQTLLAPAHKTMLINLFLRVCVRMTKRYLSRPAPKRYIVPATLSSVEMQYYADMRDQALQALGITPDGFPDRADWQLDVSMLRNVVHRLRQHCTLSIHLAAQAGGLRLGESSTGSKKIMSRAEALEQLHLDGEWKLWTQRFQLASLLLFKAQLITRGVNIAWNQTPDQELLEPHRRRDVAILNDVNQTLQSFEAEVHAQPARLTTPDSEVDVAAGRIASKAEKGLRSRLREVMILRHRCCFLLGNVYNFSHEESTVDSFKSDMTALMDRSYGDATKIRQQLLSQLLVKASKAITNVSIKLKESKVANFSQLEIDEVPIIGIVGTAIKEQANLTIDVLNANAELLWNWRGTLAELLLTPLDTEEDATGNEYEVALEAQAKAEVYLANLQLALADRREFLMEQRTLLAQEIPGKKLRKTQRAQEAGSERLRDTDEEDAGVFGAGLQTELNDELYRERQQLRVQQSKGGRPLKGLIIDLRAAIDRASRPEDKALLEAAHSSLRGVSKEQTQLLDALDKEVISVLQPAFNARVSYFKDLQALSDSLQDIDFGIVSLDLQEERVSTDITKLRAELKLGEARLRYVESLQESRTDKHSERCVLCLTDLSQVSTLVLLKGCGHDICGDCYTAYRGSAVGKRCLVCRYPIAPGDAQKVSLAPAEYGPVENVVKQEAVAGAEPAVSDLGESFVLPPNMREIAELDIAGEWSSKITSLLQNIVCIKNRSPEVKHIVFSAWREAFVIVKAALDLNGLSWVDLDAKQKDANPVQQFSRDANVSILLMCGERSVSGLDLTAASVVHLLEPLVNASFEQQAGGRIDRISQKRETYIYCYATQGTIEAKILHRAVAQGTSAWGKNASNDAIVATSVAKRGSDDLGSSEELLELLL